MVLRLQQLRWRPLLVEDDVVQRLYMNLKVVFLARSPQCFQQGVPALVQVPCGGRGPQRKDGHLPRHCPSCLRLRCFSTLQRYRNAAELLQGILEVFDDLGG